MIKRKVTLRDYTVVGFYTDNKQPFIDWRRALSPKTAAYNSKRRNPDVAIVEAFEGKQKGCLGNEEVVY